MADPDKTSRSNSLGFSPLTVEATKGGSVFLL